MGWQACRQLGSLDTLHRLLVVQCCCAEYLLRPCLQAEHSTWAAAGKQYPVTINEMLLRGCTLKNSKSIIGAVVYTGAESRIQKNAAKTPHKVGAPPAERPSLLLLRRCGCCQPRGSRHGRRCHPEDLDPGSLPPSRAPFAPLGWLCYWTGVLSCLLPERTQSAANPSNCLVTCPVN